MKKTLRVHSQTFGSVDAECAWAGEHFAVTQHSYVNVDGELAWSGGRRKWVVTHIKIGARFRGPLMQRRDAIALAKKATRLNAKHRIPGRFGKRGKLSKAGLAAWRAFQADIDEADGA